MKMVITLIITALLTACAGSQKAAEDLKENSYAYLLEQPVSTQPASPSKYKEAKEQAFKLLTTLPKPKGLNSSNYKYINIRTDYITTYEALKRQLKQVDKGSLEEQEINQRLYTLHLQFISEYK